MYDYWALCSLPLLQPGLTLHPPLPLPAANPGASHERLGAAERSRLEPERLPLERRLHQERPERPSTNEGQRLVSWEMHVVGLIHQSFALKHWFICRMEASQRQSKRLLLERWIVGWSKLLPLACLFLLVHYLRKHLSFSIWEWFWLLEWLWLLTGVTYRPKVNASELHF